MRILWLALVALLLEVGWLGLWPLAGTLSHSAAFNAAFLDGYQPARQLLDLLLGVARPVLPDLAEAPLTDPSGSAVYLVPATALAALMAWLAMCYLAALILLDRGLGAARAAIWLVLGAALVFQTTLLFLPGLFSQDVFSYIAYGHLAAIYNLNPYVWPPSAIPKDAILPWVADIWRTYANPYGPIWTDVQWVFAHWFAGGKSVADEAMAYRVLANALLLANLGLAWALLGRVTPLNRGQRTTALAALAWNPLVLFEIAGNAHNDVLMVSGSLLAVLVLTRWHGGLLAGAGFTLGALVKYLSGIGLVWVALASAARAGSASRRVAQPMVVLLVSAALVVAVFGPWLELPDSLDPLRAETVGVGYVNALPDALAVAGADLVLTPAGLPTAVARHLMRGLERFLVLIAFGVYLVWESRRVWSQPTAAGVARATAGSCLMYVLVVSTSVQTWYFYLPLALAVVLGWRATLARLTVGYSLLALPALYLHYYLRESTPLWVDLVYGLTPLLVLGHGSVRSIPARVGCAWLSIRARPHKPTATAVADNDPRAARHGASRTLPKQARR